MASAVLFIGWNRPQPGSEQAAYEFLMTEGMSYLEKQKGKYIESIEMVGLTPHGGDLNGFILLYGERAKLDELRRTDEFEAFSMQAGSRFSNWGVVPGLNLEGIKGVMTRMKARG